MNIKIKVFFSFFIFLGFSGNIFTQELPLEELILGEWNIDYEEQGPWSEGKLNFCYVFRPNHTMWRGTRDGYYGFYGDWSLSGNTLTILQSIRGKTAIILIEIIDTDTIILISEEGALADLLNTGERMYYPTRELLTRDRNRKNGI